jgi:hypothetical protein
MLTGSSWVVSVGFSLASGLKICVTCGHRNFHRIVLGSFGWVLIGFGSENLCYLWTQEFARKLSLLGIFLTRPPMIVNRKMALYFFGYIYQSCIFLNFW